MSTGAALLAALPQLLQYAGHNARQDFSGSEYSPRVEAVLASSRATLEGGPFATVPVQGGYSVAPTLIGDLGIPAAIDLWTRFTGVPATRLTLGWLNLVIMVAACVFLVFAFPLSLRWWLIPVFLLVPLVVPAYSSLDSVAAHGSLAVLAVAIAMATLRSTRAWFGLGFGVALFFAHKARLVYGIYAIGALLPGLGVAARVFRNRRPFQCAAFLLLGFAICEIPWRFAVAARRDDPRVVEKDTLPEHNIFGPLVAGIGWTPNPWGMKPWDPWVAQFLADSVHGNAVNLATRESERRARLVYSSKVREHPGELFRLYLGRIPRALTDLSILGPSGAFLWIFTGGIAIVLAIARRDQEGLYAVLPPIGVAVGLILQIIVLDTRLLYGYPLQFVSAIILASSIPVALRNARRAVAEPANSPA